MKAKATYYCTLMEANGKWMYIGGAGGMVFAAG
jgi:hypothetical protein